MYLLVQKFIGALLPTLLAVFVLSLLSEALFTPAALEKPAYEVEVAEKESESDDAGAGEEASSNVMAMIADADPGDGEKAAKKCASCHTFDNGGANRVGPNLYGVVNRAAAAVDGFKYSTALSEWGADNRWTYENLDAFLEAPKQAVPGTSMAFAGVRKPTERAALITYLRSLADTPAPLPEPAAAAEEAAPATEEAAKEDAEPASEATEETKTDAATDDPQPATGTAEEPKTDTKADEGQPATGAAEEPKTDAAAEDSDEKKRDPAPSAD